MINVFISVFVITALALMFSHAWNLVAETALSTWEITGIDPDTGEEVVKAPVIQTTVYAIVITLISIGVLYFIHYFTEFDLGSGFRRNHRD